MYAVRLPLDADEELFRAAARRCLALNLSPADIVFEHEKAPSLLLPVPEAPTTWGAFKVPKSFGALVQEAICHSAHDRFSHLYDLLWRITHGERSLISRASDAHVARLNNYARNVRRDIHKMHAFLRFRAREIGGKTLFTAWIEPQHFILKRAVPFFVERFSNLDWVIATPNGTATFIDGQLQLGPPPPRKPDAANDAVLDEMWLAYYRTTFNPARLRTKAMVAEMPKHYWANLPEAALIPHMVANADNRVSRMAALPADQPHAFAERIVAQSRAKAVTPVIPIERLRADATECTRCPLHRAATQTVFGEGPADAKLIFVGEQPGDQEDLIGRPFAGPAGDLFDRALSESGLDRNTCYITNAVKHFKYEPRGKRRIHQRPNSGEVDACRWWLQKEIETIKPWLIVALGSTAAKALAHRPVSVTRERGPTMFGTQRGFITVHPSYLLRIPSVSNAQQEHSLFLNDLRQISQQMIGLRSRLKQEAPC